MEKGKEREREREKERETDRQIERLRVGGKERERERERERVQAEWETGGNMTHAWRFQHLITACSATSSPRGEREEEEEEEEGSATQEDDLKAKKRGEIHFQFLAHLFRKSLSGKNEDGMEAKASWC